jgi:hypothetical protein
VLVCLLVCSGTVDAVLPANSAPANANASPCRPAELFATDNTGDELRLFELMASATIALNGAEVTGSTLLDGVFWSDELQQASSERARQFHLCVLDQSMLHATAEALRRQFNQQAVLTFDYLPDLPDTLPHSLPGEGTNALAITVPDIDITRFHDAFVADSVAHRRLLGGSVTTCDHTLILVAAKDDVDIARRLVGEAGGDWATATIASGDREFVS